MLEDIVISRVRIKLLQAFLEAPTEIFYVRQLVRWVKEEINAVRRELERLEKAGMIAKEKRGNRVYYGFNKNYPLFSDLLSIVHKSVGLGGEIYKLRNKIGKVKFALLSGRFVRRLAVKSDSVDLLLVGEVDLSQLAKLVKRAEEQIGREINYSVMSRDEFEFRKKRHDPFLTGILGGSRVIVIGDEEEMIG
ncbi:MAG: winged helix-turn-helix domain-containing protein [Candidatus Shapirobacteria bacterium]